MWNRTTCALFERNLFVFVLRHYATSCCKVSWCIHISVDSWVKTSFIHVDNSSPECFVVCCPSKNMTQKKRIEHSAPEITTARNKVTDMWQGTGKYNIHLADHLAKCLQNNAIENSYYSARLSRGLW